MRKVFGAIAVAGLLVSGCKETPPYINYAASVPSVDTTYVITSLPGADPHNILLEDFTGQTCPNCPNAHQIIVALETANPGRINAIGMYVNGQPQTQPPAGAKYDFRNTLATQIQSSVYSGLVYLPIGGIDRLPLSASNKPPIQIDRSEWTSDVATRLPATDSINLAITSAYDSTTNTATINVTATYLYGDSTTRDFSIALVEDSMVDLQEDESAASNIDTFYHFDDVFRDFVTTPPFGDPIAPKLTYKQPGTVYRRTYNYKVSPLVLNVNNCRLIAYINGSATNGGTPIYQSVQTKLK